MRFRPSDDAAEDQRPSLSKPNAYPSRRTASHSSETSDIPSRAHSTASNTVELYGNPPRSDSSSDDQAMRGVAAHSINPRSSSSRPDSIASRTDRASQPYHTPPIRVVRVSPEDVDDEVDDEVDDDAVGVSL